MYLVGPRVIDEFKKAKDKEMQANSVFMKKIIDELGDKRILELSEGQKRIVAIMSAILQDAKIVILDEPTVGLDRGYRQKMLSMLKEASKEKIIIITTNDLRIINHADTIILLREGKVAKIGPPKEVLDEDFIFPLPIVRFARKMTELGINTNRKIVSKEELEDLIRSFIC